MAPALPKADTAPRAGPPDLLSRMANLGQIALVRDEPARAAELLKRSLDRQRQPGDKYSIASVLNSLSKVALVQGDLPRAADLCWESVAPCQDTGSQDLIVDNLETLAALAAQHGRPVEAARLWGAAEGQRERLGLILPPMDRALQDRQITAARAAVRTDDFAAEWAAGRALSLDEALALAEAGPTRRYLPPPTPQG
jgi:hypothetical protein